MEPVPVIMCVWQRPERLTRTLELLSSQTVPCRLHLWLNNAPLAPQVKDIITTAPLPVTLTVSETNIGGAGRFHLAGSLGAEHVVFIDDDQEMQPDSIQTLWEQRGARRIASQWAWRLLTADSYWQRERAGHDQTADYCGTGGMVADASIFSHPSLWQCPPEFWWIEDLWLSYVATDLGWQLVGSAAQFEMISDGRDQWLLPDASGEKDRFLRHLVARGWHLPASHQWS